MPFNDAELDRLGDQRRSLKQEQRMCTEEMKETYSAIQEIKDRLPLVYDELGTLREAMREANASFAELRNIARSNGDWDGVRAYQEAITANHDEVDGIRAEIDRLKDEKNELWERHNEAKERRRLAEAAYAEVETDFQNRLTQLRG